MAQLRVSQWAGRPLTETEARIVDAAIDMNVVKATSCKYAEIVARSEAPKGSAYRACDGMQGVIDLLHRDTIRSIFTVAKTELEKIRETGAGTDFAKVVEAGINGVLLGLTEARWTGSVLWRERDEVTGYLLRRGEGGIYSRLVGFATWCAVNRGAAEADARPAAEQLVWKILAAAVLALSPLDNVEPDWPAHVKDLEKLVQSFASDLGLAGTPPPAFFPGDLFSDRPGTDFALLAGAPV